MKQKTKANNIDLSNILKCMQRPYIQSKNKTQVHTTVKAQTPKTC